MGSKLVGRVRIASGNYMAIVDVEGGPTSLRVWGIVPHRLGVRDHLPDDVIPRTQRQAEAVEWSHA